MRKIVLLYVAVACIIGFSLLSSANAYSVYWNTQSYYKAWDWESTPSGTNPHWKSWMLWGYYTHDVWTNAYAIPPSPSFSRWQFIEKQHHVYSPASSPLGGMSSQMYCIITGKDQSWAPMAVGWKICYGTVNQGWQIQGYNWVYAYVNGVETFLGYVGNGWRNDGVTISISDDGSTRTKMVAIVRDALGNPTTYTWFVDQQFSYVDNLINAFIGKAPYKDATRIEGQIIYEYYNA